MKLTEDQRHDLEIMKKMLGAQIQMLDEIAGLTPPTGTSESELLQGSLMMAVGGMEFIKSLLLQMATESVRGQTLLQRIQNMMPPKTTLHAVKPPTETP
jgi:hypothetical protein